MLIYLLIPPQRGVKSLRDSKQLGMVVFASNISSEESEAMRQWITFPSSLDYILSSRSAWAK